VEPNLPNAASHPNVGFPETGQKRNRNKAGFAKGLWHRIFCDLSIMQSPVKNYRFRQLRSRHREIFGPSEDRTRKK
jgi:hypothetical protein